MLLRGVPSLVGCMQARGSRMPVGLSRRRPSNRLCRHIIHAAPQQPPAQLRFDHALRQVNGMRPLQLRVPAVQELLLLTRAAVNEQQALKYNSSSLQSIQVWAEDMLDKLCGASTDRLSPQTVADVWETVATLKHLNSEFGRNAENKQLLKKLRRFQVEAGNEVYTHAQPGALLAVLKAQKACDLQEGIEFRMAELLDGTSKDPRFLESCSADSFLHTVHFLAPMSTDLKLQTVEWMKAACDRLAPPLSVPSSPSTKRDFLHWSSEGLAHVGHFFASLPQVSWRPEPGWLLHKAEAALALMTPRTDSEPLVRLLLALLAPDNTLLSESHHLQQGIRATCRLLQSNMSSAQRPLESMSTPTLLLRLSELLLDGAGGEQADPYSVLQAIDPHFPAVLVSVQRANVNTQLAHPTAQLLVRLAESCRTAQQQQQQQQQQEQQQNQSSLHGTQVLEASAAGAANSLLKSWTSDIPDNLALLLLLPSLSRVAGVELPKKLQEEMEHALAEKQRLKQLANRGDVLHMVVMQIAEAGGHCFLPTTLEICLPRLDELVQVMPPLQLAALISSFSKAPWSPRSPMRARLLAAAFQSLSRCSPLEVQELVTACACVVRQPAVSTATPPRSLPGVQYDAKDSVPVPSAEDWSTHVEACVADSSFDLPPDARCALLHSLCVCMGGSLTDASLYKLMQPLLPCLGECSHTSIVLLMEAVATLRKAPATDAWPLAVLDAAGSALSSNALAGLDLARAVASLPAFCHQQLGIISAPSVEGPPLPPLSASVPSAEAAAAVATAREGGSAATEEAQEPSAAASPSDAVQRPHAVLEVGTLVVGRVTAVCPDWLEVELIEAIDGQQVGAGVSGHSNQEGSSSSSSSASGRGGDVAGMKGRIALTHLSAAPVESPSDLLPEGTLVKAVVLPPLSEHALEVSLSMLVIEPTIGALVLWGPQAIFDLAERVWSSRFATGHGLMEEWAKSSSVSTEESSKTQTFQGYPIPFVRATSGEPGLQESRYVASEEAAAAADGAKAGPKQQEQQQQQQQNGHDHAALFSRCRTLARNGVAALIQPSKLAQLAGAELPDYMAGAACALAACDLHGDAQLFKAYEDWSLKTMSLLPQTMSHTALSHMLWAYAQLSYQPSWGWLAGAAQHLSPQLYTMAKAEPGNHARVLAGLHAQLLRPDYMKPFTEAQPNIGSSSSSRSSSNPLANSPAAAPGSLYCASNLTTLPPSAATVVRAARHAGAAFVAAACSSPSPQQQHQQQQQQQQQQQDPSLDTLLAAICALAAMNTPHRDCLCPLMLQQQQQQQQQQQKQQQQASWPSPTSWQRLLQPSALPAQELRPSLAWFLSVDEQLQDLHAQRKTLQQQEEEAGRAVHQPAAQWVQFEQIAAAVLALQLRSSSGGGSAAAAGALLATVSNVHATALPAGHMPEPLQHEVACSATIITAAARAAVPLPTPYVQQFLSATIGQDMNTAAASLALARSAGRYLAAETADRALPNLAQHLEQLAISIQERQPNGNAGLLVQLHSILSAVQLCPPSSKHGSSKSPSPLYLPPPSFTQAAMALLSACCPLLLPPAGKSRSPQSSSHKNASIVGSVGIIVDWMAAQQQPQLQLQQGLQQEQQQQQQQQLQPPALGSFALDLEPQRQALGLLAASAPGTMPALHTALGQLLHGRAGNAAGSSEIGVDVWYQALWLSHLLEEPKEQSGASSNDSSAGDNSSSSSSSKLGPALHDWGMLSPAALAGHFRSQPQMMAVAFARLAKLLEAYCQMIWRQVDSSKDAALQANRIFGALMPSAHWANLFLKAVGRPGVLAACDESMLLQVISGLSALGVGSRDPQTKVKAAPYLPHCSFIAAARTLTIFEHVEQKMSVPSLRPHPSSLALQAIVQRVWATDIEHAHEIRHAVHALMLLAIAFYDHKAQHPSSDLPSFLSLISSQDHAKPLHLRIQKLIDRAAEDASTGHLEAQQVLVVLDFVLLLQSSLETVTSVFPDIEPHGNGSAVAMYPMGISLPSNASSTVDCEYQLAATGASHNVVSALLPKAAGFMHAHEGSEAAAVLLYQAQRFCQFHEMDETHVTQDLLRLLNRHHALPLVWVKLITDSCFALFRSTWPATEICRLEQLISDAAVGQLVQRAMHETPLLAADVSWSIVLTIASICGLTKLPPYDLGNHSPFMSLRPGVSSLHFSKLVQAQYLNVESCESIITSHILLRAPCIWNADHGNFVPFRTISGGFLDIFKALRSDLEARCEEPSGPAILALMNAALMRVLRVGDQFEMTDQKSQEQADCYNFFSWIATCTDDASVFFKAMEMLYGTKTRLPHDNLVVYMTLGSVGQRPQYDYGTDFAEFWSSYLLGAKYPEGFHPFERGPECQLLAERGLQMLVKPTPQALEPSLQPAYNLVGSSSQSSINMEHASRRRSSFKPWMAEQVRQVDREKSDSGLSPAGALKHSILGGCLDGGQYASRHLEVWRAALVYGLAAQAPSSRERPHLLQQALDVFVSAADEAFSDTAMPPVQVEEVVVWLGPCLAGVDIAADPVALPEGVPFRRWLHAADWSGLFEALPECDTDTEAKHSLPGEVSVTVSESREHFPDDLPDPFPSIPEDLAGIDPSAQLVAAYACDMDPRLLLQLSSSWMMCSEFKLLFWEVLSSKAGWPCKLGPGAGAAAVTSAAMEAYRSNGQKGGVRPSVAKSSLWVLLQKWASWESNLQEAQQTSDTDLSGVSSEQQQDQQQEHREEQPHPTGMDSIAESMLDTRSPHAFQGEDRPQEESRPQRNNPAPTSALAFATAALKAESQSFRTRKGALWDDERKFASSLRKTSAKTNKARGKKRDGKQSKAGGSMWTKD